MKGPFKGVSKKKNARVFTRVCLKVFVKGVHGVCFYKLKPTQLFN